MNKGCERPGMKAKAAGGVLRDHECIQQQSTNSHDPIFIQKKEKLILILPITRPHP